MSPDNYMINELAEKNQVKAIKELPDNFQKICNETDLKISHLLRK